MCRSALCVFGPFIRRAGAFGEGGAISDRLGGLASRLSLCPDGDFQQVLLFPDVLLAALAEALSRSTGLFLALF